MNKNLLLTYWSSPDIARNKEVLDTISKNIELNVFNTITIFTEINSDKDINKFKSKKVEIIVDSRKTYQDIFNYSNVIFSSSDCVNILANSDIEFDESINVAESISEKDFFALTRYDRNTNELQKGYLKDLSDSQDVWIWRGFNFLQNCNFYLGIPGCDNKIAFNAFDGGYTVRNPSKTIKTYHNHLTESRTGTSKNLNMRIERPYCYLKPTHIDEKFVICTEETEAKPVLFKVDEDLWEYIKSQKEKYSN